MKATQVICVDPRGIATLIAPAPSRPGGEVSLPLHFSKRQRVTTEEDRIVGMKTETHPDVHRVIKTEVEEKVESKRPMDSGATGEPVRADGKTGPSVVKRSTAAMCKKEKNQKKKKEQKMEWSERQQRVMDAVMGGRSVLVTGSAGTGKSVVVQHLIDRLPETSTYVTGSTGLAAVQLGGVTLHSFAGIGLGDEPVQQLIDKVRGSRRASKNWRSVRVLVVDEISMIPAPLFDKLEQIARTVRGNEQPFGGIQLILSGDFLQLPPVEKNGKALYCFQAKCWNRCVQETIELDNVYRQSDSLFVRVLSEVRRGKCSEEGQRLFRSCVGRVLPCEDGIKATVIYPCRKEVAGENETRLAELKEEEVEFHAQDSGEPAYVATLQRSAPAETRLVLKKGAQVLLTKNIAPEKGLVNGSRGVVIGFGPADESGDTKDIKKEEEKKPDGQLLSLWKKYIKGTSGAPNMVHAMIHPQRRWPIVRFVNGREMVIEPETWEARAGGKTLAERIQIPLLLGYSCTTHKSQGMTLDKGVISLARVFEYGQAYVALSRLRSIEGLSLLDFNVGVIRASPVALAFYESLDFPSSAGIPPSLHPSPMLSTRLDKRFGHDKEPRLLSSGASPYSGSEEDNTPETSGTTTSLTEPFSFRPTCRKHRQPCRLVPSTPSSRSTTWSYACSRGCLFVITSTTV